METGGTKGFGRFGWASRTAARLVTEAGRVGVDPSESGDATLQRRILVIMSVGTLPLTVLWSIIYFSAGARLAAPAPAPAVYSFVTPINTVLLQRTRNFGLYRFIQLLMTLRPRKRETLSNDTRGRPEIGSAWTCPRARLKRFRRYSRRPPAKQKRREPTKRRPLFRRLAGRARPIRRDPGNDLG